MKKAISLIVILVMVMALAACSKSDPENDKKDAEPTKEPEITQALPAKEQEPAADPESEPEEPSEEDEFFSEGHKYEGIWQSGNVVLRVSPEGAADVLTVYAEATDLESFGSWHEYWTNFSEEENRFVGSDDRYVYFDENGEYQSQVEEGTYIFEVDGDVIRWAEMEFEKISDDTADNPLVYDYDAEPVELEIETFGETFTQESPDFVDVVATTFVGAYCENTQEPEASYYYPYANDVRSMENMDEFVAAFLSLGVEEDQGQLCFLDEGMNEDISWTMEDGVISVTDSIRNAVYYGEFYWDSEGEDLYVKLGIDGYNVWMVAEK